MRLVAALTALVPLALLGQAAARPVTETDHVARETLQEAARHARLMAREITTGTIASVFPAGSENAGRPFALMDSHAACGPADDLLFISFPISLSARNIRADPRRSATYTLRLPPAPGRSEFGSARVAFIGNLTTLDPSPAERAALEACYTAAHPDARGWLPGDPDGAHTSAWARLDVDDVYYVGGFGDTKYVGHIPVDVYMGAGEGRGVEIAGAAQVAWA